MAINGRKCQKRGFEVFQLAVTVCYAALKHGSPAHSLIILKKTQGLPLGAV